MSIRYPAPLGLGDRIAVTSPSAGVGRQMRPRLEFCIKHLRDLGYEVVVGDCMDRSGVTSSPAPAGAAELTAMLVGPVIRAVVPPWGGELAIDLLPLLDFEAISAAEPTWLVGYSALTTVMVPLTLRTGVATVHGSDLSWTPRAGSVALIDEELGQGRPMRRRLVQVPPPRSGFAGFRFPPEAILVAVRWYLRYGLSYRDVEELLAERGIAVDHVTVYRWVQRFTPLLIDAARPCRHAPGDRWFIDETYVKVSGRWIYLYRAIDQFGQVIDVLVSRKRDLAATRRFFNRALMTTTLTPVEIITDKAAVYPRVLEELAPGAWHHTDQYANNSIEADHSRLKARLRPMRGLKRLRSAQTVSAGHAFVQNVRRGHYELGVDVDARHRFPAVFIELALAI